MWRISCSRHKIWYVQFQKLTDSIYTACRYDQIILCCNLKIGCWVFPGNFALLRSSAPLLGTLRNVLPTNVKVEEYGEEIAC